MRITIISFQFFLILLCSMKSQWEVIKVPYLENQGLHRAIFFNHLQGVGVFGPEQAILAETSDGGITWQRVQTQFDSYPTLNLKYSLLIVPGTNKYCVAFGYTVLFGEYNKGIIRELHDFPGQEPLTSVCGVDSTGGDFYLTSMASIDSNHIWLSGNRKLMFTSDMGISWECRQLADSGKGLGHDYIVFMDSLRGVSVYYELGFPRHTLDGGKSWSTSGNLTPSKRLSSFGLFRTPSGKVFSVGSNFGVSLDSGRSFSTLDYIFFPACSTFAMCDEGYGWAAGIGSFHRTTDDGVTWEDWTDSTDYTEPPIFRLGGLDVSDFSCDTVYLSRSRLARNFNARGRTTEVAVTDSDKLSTIRVVHDAKNELLRISAPTTITSIRIMDLLGNSVVNTSALTGPSSSVTLSTAHVASGTYFIIVATEHEVKGEMVLVWR